jgi:hypothetical protein
MTLPSTAFDQLLDRSSLGHPAVRAIRARTSAALVDVMTELVQRLDRNAVGDSRQKGGDKTSGDEPSGTRQA